MPSLVNSRPLNTWPTPGLQLVEMALVLDQRGARQMIKISTCRDAESRSIASISIEILRKVTGTPADFNA